MATLAELKATVTELETEGRTLITAFKSDTLTPRQSARLDVIKEELEAARKTVKSVETGAALLAGISAVDEAAAQAERGGGLGQYIGGQKSITGLVTPHSTAFSFTKSSMQGAAKAITEKTREISGGFGVKSIVTAGSYDGAPLTSDIIQPLSRNVSSVLELLPSTLIDGRHVSYMRQSTRDLKAAVVAPGGLKPTSKIGLEKVDFETKVVAHLSEPIDVFLLEDIAGAGTIVGNELQYGLYNAMDNQVLNGNGTTELDGLLTTPGIQVQAFVTDALTSIRTGITKARVAGQEPEFIVMGYADWQGIELLKETTGAYLLNAASPVDVAAKRLWGLQVVESANMAAGTALIGHRGAAGVAISKPGVRLTWHVSGADFETNATRARCEIRANLIVTTPSAFVKVALAGA